MRFKALSHIVFALFAAVCCFGAAAATTHSVEDSAVTSAGVSSDSTALAEGLQLYEAGEFEDARERLLRSVRSGDSYIRAESFLYLNALEMESGNYEAARPWLERYHAETIGMLRRAAEAERRMADEMTRLDRRHRLFTGGMICLGVLLVGAGVFVVWRRRMGQVVRRAGGNVAEVAGTGSAGETDSDMTADVLEWKSYLIDAEIFKQTAIYAEIEALARQSKGRDARVMSSVRQEVLDGELAVRFERFAARLRAEYPSLTAGDVKLCCLSLLPLSSFGRALCFGSTETNIVKQRKHVIKKKVGAGGYGRAVFEFIFEGRG